MSIKGQIEPGGAFAVVFVGVSAPRAELLKKNGAPVPGRIKARALLDIGATCTCIDKAIIETLGILPTGSTLVQTPSTGNSSAECETFDVELGLPVTAGSATGSRVFRALPIVAIDLSLQANRIEALIGRDVLNTCILIYDGPAKQFTIAF